jgi:hypothetical protein
MTNEYQMKATNDKAKSKEEPGTCWAAGQPGPGNYKWCLFTQTSDVTQIWSVISSQDDIFWLS